MAVFFTIFGILSLSRYLILASQTMQEYRDINFIDHPLAHQEFEEVIFRSCDFRGVNLDGHRFELCSFISCQMSLTTFSETLLQNITFEDCILTGIQLHEAKPFLFECHFKQCDLSMASFFALDLKKCSFDHCRLREADLVQSNLNGLNLSHCDFFGATFEGTQLVHTDFRSSINIVLDPNKNTLGSTRFTSAQLPGLLQQFDIIVD